MPQANHLFVEVQSSRIHYREIGTGEPIVLLHTGGASSYQYETMFAALSERFRVIAWDMPGHGDSDPIARHRTIEDYALTFSAFLDALGVQRPIVLGSSIGGHISVAFARVRPERLRRLLVVEAPIRSAEWYEINWDLFEGMNAIPLVSWEDLAPRFQSLTRELHARWNKDRSKAGAWTLVDIAWATRDFDMAAGLAALRVPLTVMAGEHGPTVAEFPRYKSLQPDADYITLAGCGHFPMNDDPAALVEAVMKAVALDGRATATDRNAAGPEVTTTLGASESPS